MNPFEEQRRKLNDQFDFDDNELKRKRLFTYHDITEAETKSYAAGYDMGEIQGKKKGRNRQRQETPPAWIWFSLGAVLAAFITSIILHIN